MKAIKIVTSSYPLGVVVPSGVTSHEIFRRAVGESWTTYYAINKNVDLIRFIEFHNSTSFVQIERLETEEITLD